MPCVLAIAVAGCGGGERQDENEPEGEFKVELVNASFPSDQSLAKPSEVSITVRNLDKEEIPNIAVTLNGLDTEIKAPNVADPRRPIFVLNASPRRIGNFPEAKEDSPPGGETAYVNTWALGKLKPNEEKTFRWKVTAVRAGPYRLTYSISAGLDGKAKAVDAAGNTPKGLFIGTVSDAAPDTRIAEDGKTVIRSQ